MGLFKRRKTVSVDCDILVVGGGMAGCGATYESRYWGRDLKIVCVEKANIERSGAVAQGLYAINCYMGMQWGENQPEDHVRYARNDLMGLVREDLGYDIARHVDATVHKFEEWGLPIMKNPETGQYQREGKWQIMIHGESYKPIVAEAASKAATQVYNRIMVTHLLMDDTKPNRIAGAVGFNVRTGDFYVFRAKAVIVSAGGASHIFKPRAAGEGMGRTWYAPWSSASAYALPILAGPIVLAALFVERLIGLVSVALQCPDAVLTARLGTGRHEAPHVVRGGWHPQGSYEFGLAENLAEYPQRGVVHINRVCGVASHTSILLRVRRRNRLQAHFSLSTVRLRAAHRVGEREPGLLAERVAVGELGRSGDRAGGDAVGTAGAPADQRPDEGAEARRLLPVEVARGERRDRAHRVLAHDEEVDQADDVRLLQPLELREDLAAELVPVEDERPDLNRPEAGQPVEHGLQRQLGLLRHAAEPTARLPGRSWRAVS